MKELSKCCNKPKVANYTDEGTGCYLCQGCLGEFIPTTPKEEERLREEFRKLNHCGSLQIIEDYILKTRREAIAGTLNTVYEVLEDQWNPKDGAGVNIPVFKSLLKERGIHLTQE